MCDEEGYVMWKALCQKAMKRIMDEVCKQKSASMLECLVQDTY